MMRKKTKMSRRKKKLKKKRMIQELKMRKI